MRCCSSIEESLMAEPADILAMRANTADVFTFLIVRS